METLLKDYLKKYITVSTYFKIIDQILSMLENIHGKGMQIALDLEQMQVENNRVKYQIIAEESVYEAVTIKEFLKELTFACVFANGENCAEITEFLRYMEYSWQGRDYAELREYYTGATQAPVYRQPESRVQSGRLDEVRETMNVTRSGQLQSDETGVLDPAFWEHQSSKLGNDGETGVLDPSFWNTALKNTPSSKLAVSAPKAMVYPKLVHSRTNKETEIRKESFWIGKGSTDLVIEKDVISRKHAELVVKGNHYFIIDNDSTNKTFVDGKQIPARASVEIYDGTKIKFADEEYIFYTK